MRGCAAARGTHELRCGRGGRRLVRCQVRGAARVGSPPHPRCRLCGESSACASGLRRGGVTGCGSFADEMGVPRIDGGGRGDLVVLLELETPKKLSKKQRQLLEEFAQESGMEYAHRQGLFEKWFSKKKPKAT